jgi:hypothetical protein
MSAPDDAKVKSDTEDECLAATTVSIDLMIHQQRVFDRG